MERLEEVLMVTKNRGNRENNGKGRDKSQSKSRSRYKNLECYHCGHLKKYCFKWKKENKGGGDEHDQNDDEKFDRIASATREDLLMGNEGLVPVTSMGNVNLVSNNGTKLTLKDVRHAPDIRLNLISAGKFDDERFCNTFSEGQWKLTKGSLVEARGKKSSNLYLMHASISRDTVNVTANENSTELWHKWLSHMSEKGHNFLAKKNQILGLKNATLKKYAHFLAKKQRRVFFRSRPPHRRSELLELVHSDVCGPIKKEDSSDIGDLATMNLVPMDLSPNHIQDDVRGDVNYAQQDMGNFDAPIDNVVNDQQQTHIAPPTAPLWRSSRDQ
ncbi:hypothetical protein V6N12_065028 [Hibiscus sabdariffa]|uniref:GAG-pre-integrase domain-containing protein n=1 Tax=Hibiscus sabdariffa TaxID=183260 RepID=A0ABR2G7V5_9ROSI